MRTQNPSAAQLLAHILAMRDAGADLEQIECWGWDDGSIIFQNHSTDANVPVTDLSPERVRDEDYRWPH